MVIKEQYNILINFKNTQREEITMIVEPPKRTWVVIVVTIISAAAVIIAAIISLGLPFAEHWADIYFSKLTPTIIAEATEQNSKENTTLTPVEDKARWDFIASQIPNSGSQISVQLSSGQLLFFSGGQIQFASSSCGNDKDQICILILTSTKDQIVNIEELIPKNNWYGISSTFDIDEAITEMKPLFWLAPNCGKGCKRQK